MEWGAIVIFLTWALGVSAWAGSLQYRVTRINGLPERVARIEQDVRWTREKLSWLCDRIEEREERARWASDSTKRES